MLKWIIDNPEAIHYFSDKNIHELLRKAKMVFKDEPRLVSIPPGNILVAGDTHGNFEATRRIVNIFLSGPGGGAPYDRIVFLGDYVDRGAEQIDNINYLLALKLLLPSRVILLRGNHEDAETNTKDGFLAKIIGRFGADLSIHEHYNRIFSLMPIAALTWSGHFLVHGGIPEGLWSLRQIHNMPREAAVKTNQLLLELLWNDPSERADRFGRSHRGKEMKTFGEKVLKRFLKMGVDLGMFEQNRIDLRAGPREQWRTAEPVYSDDRTIGGRGKLTMFIRSHEYWHKGYRYFFDGKLLSIFSSPGYLDRDNSGSLASIDREGNVSVITI